MAQHQHQKSTDVAANKPEEETATSTEVIPKMYVPDFPQVLTEAVANCMRNRDNIRQGERQLDAWFLDLPKDLASRIKVIDDARTQIETARQALDALYSRFRQLAVSNRA